MVSQSQDNFYTLVLFRPLLSLVPLDFLNTGARYHVPNGYEMEAFNEILQFCDGRF
jgi:hypothetical protein